MKRTHLFSLMLGTMLLCSCSSMKSISSSSVFSNGSLSSASSTASFVNVAFAQSEHYTLPRYLYSVPKGGDLEVELTLVGRYSLTGVSYADSSFELLESNQAKVTLRAIRYSTRVEFTFDPVQTTFVYHLNGGHFYQGSGEEYRLPATDQYHARPNLDVGIDRIHRFGYTLIGWEDEAGLITGLGSRYTLPSSSEVHFQAVWAPWDHYSKFSYVHEGDGAYLTGYWGEGNVDTLVIPDDFGGKPLLGIHSGAIKSVHFGTVVLPPSLKSLEQSAFYDCEIDKIYFFDSLQNVDDSSFQFTKTKQCHILTSHPSRGLANDPNTQFVEDMDRLILRKDKKKIVFFAGCSGSYSINSRTLEETFGDEYEICNMAVLGGTNGSAMMEAIIPFLGKDDLFIHAPEEMSEYQLMHSYASDNRLFFLFMGNYDALALADVSIIPNFWTSFGEYVELLEEDWRLDHETFNARSVDYNEYGDYSWVRPNSPDDTDFGIEGAFYVPYVNQASCARLSAYYQQVAEKGAKALFTYAPINENAVNRLDPSRRQMRDWVASFTQYVTDTTIISVPEDSILPGRYFFDKDYHVTEEGREIRTAHLISDLQAYFDSK